MPSNIGKITRIALAAAIAASGAIATTAFTTTAAHAVGSSTAGGAITRNEVLARAQSWVDENVPYSQSSYKTDSNGTYRQDCSGFISMAWHINVSGTNYGFTTGTLPNYATELGSLDSLQPGDAIDNISSHTALFAGWTDSGHTAATIFEEAHTGTNARTRTMTRSEMTSGGFRPFRYDKIVGSGAGAGTESGGAGRVRWADWDGDGKADYVIVNDDGSVRVFINKGGDGHGGWTDWGQVALGTTNDRTRIRFADFDGDGRADYITLAANGAVNVYLNKGGDGHGGWTDLGQVALGLVPDPDQVRFADFDGDGRTDYIVTQPSGAIGVYRNNGGDGHGGWTDLGQVALGVTNDRTRIRWADIDGDGRADYNILNPDGSITTYINHGGDTGSGWTLRSKITSGLTTDQNLVHLADITGDGRADYLLVNGPTNAFVNNGGDDQNTPGWIDYGQIALGA